MNNFWLNNANTTFYKVKSSGVYGKIDFNVKNPKDKVFESVLKNNGIAYKKKTSTINYMA